MVGKAEAKMARGKSSQQTSITLISEKTKMEGNLVFAEQLCVLGEVSGNLNADEPSAELTVSEGGRVSGEVRVPKVVISGRLDGNVYASEYLKLSKSAVVSGDLHYRSIEVAVGAQVDGRLVPMEAESSAGKGTVRALPIEGK
ncbi:MAG TPA: cell shape determination protein CcmA [Gammaproteobacteria bacterium]|nr:cell shape determination protein CcmA [Gammaproteobacteria bacterium]|tara:strand:- start:185 stop:613 length:429 start_codon:yes stop_codon:yes gene_type:complete